MSEHCGCSVYYNSVDTDECLYPALVAEVERLRAFVRENCGPQPNVEFEEVGPGTTCMTCGEEDSAHAADCLWLACR